MLQPNNNDKIDPKKRGKKKLEFCSNHAHKLPQVCDISMASSLFLSTRTTGMNEQIIVQSFPILVYNCPEFPNTCISLAVIFSLSFSSVYILFSNPSSAQSIQTIQRSPFYTKMSWILQITFKRKKRKIN